MQTNQTSPDSSSNPVPKFGTFLGVYTPSVLTILGLIMYLRFGWVVGNVGLGLTILIVLMASSITFITGLSASAIATNMRVGVGGEYYMISHSLGLELGGAIGIPLFLCRTLSITFYSFGLSESILSLWPAHWGDLPSSAVQFLTAGIILLISVISGKSAELALKLQIPIMIAVGMSLVALMIGVFTGDLHAPEWVATYRTAPQGFWYVFAVFFPAVTGFTAGIGMSGDLKDPRRSIPTGTLLAVVTGTLTYIFIPILLSITGRVSFNELAQPGIIWLNIAFLGAWLVYPGIWGAILSSAFGSVLGGPRVLQALASDGLMPARLAKLSKSGQPVIATVVSATIALLAVCLGGLNTVAQFVTILFLTLYVTINLSAALEKLVGDPSYRPTISVPWYVSLLGSAGALALMLLINPVASVVALFLELLLYLFLRSRSLQKRWGDVRAGIWVSIARFALIKLRQHGGSPRNWRPQILLFSGDVSKRISLVRMASWFNQNKGILTVCKLIEGDLTRDKQEPGTYRNLMSEEIVSQGLTAFCEVDVVPDFEAGVIDIAQASGITDLHANTIMFGWSRKQERLEGQLRMMRAIGNAGKSTVIARINWVHEPGRQPSIDIWWGGLQNNGDLMLLLAYLLSLNSEWKQAKLHVRSIVNAESDRDDQLKAMKSLLEEVRINAEYHVITRKPDESIKEIIHAHSRNADVVFLGLREPQAGEEAEYAHQLTDLVDGLSTTVLVRNAGEFAGELI